MRGMRAQLLYYRRKQGQRMLQLRASKVIAEGDMQVQEHMKAVDLNHDLMTDLLYVHMDTFAFLFLSHFYF